MTTLRESMTKPKAEPCPKCGHVDWTFDAVGISCSCGYIREKQKRWEKGEQAGFMSLAAMKAAEASPEPRSAPEETQARADAIRSHIGALVGAMDTNPVETWSHTDERWRRYWLLDARLRYADMTLRMMEKTGEPLYCPVHEPGQAGGQRYCERCAMPGIEQAAEALWKEWVA